MIKSQIKYTTFSTETPERITSTHYKIRSSNPHSNEFYDLHFYDARWHCSCPAAEPPLNEYGRQMYQPDDNCKHRRRLNEFIRVAEQQQKEIEAKNIKAQAESIIENVLAPDKAYSPTITDAYTLATRTQHAAENIAIEVDENEQRLFEVETLVKGLRQAVKTLSTDLDKANSLLTEQSLQIDLLIKQVEALTQRLEAVAKRPPVINVVASQVKVSQPHEKAQAKKPKMTEDEGFEILRQLLLAVG